jgi:hypothetical protein
MKMTTFVLAFSALFVFSVTGQDAKGGDTNAELQSPKKEEKKAAVIPPTTTTNQIFGTRVTYGGYLTELKRADKKRALLSLRTPPDPKKDMENLWFYPGTDKIQGVVLFSIKF